MSSLTPGATLGGLDWSLAHGAEMLSAVDAVMKESPGKQPSVLSAYCGGLSYGRPLGSVFT